MKLDVSNCDDEGLIDLIDCFKAEIEMELGGDDPEVVEAREQIQDVIERLEKIKDAR